MQRSNPSVLEPFYGGVRTRGFQRRRACCNILTRASRLLQKRRNSCSERPDDCWSQGCRSARPMLPTKLQSRFAGSRRLSLAECQTSLNAGLGEYRARHLVRRCNRTVILYRQVDRVSGDIAVLTNLRAVKINRIEEIVFGISQVSYRKTSAKVGTVRYARQEAVHRNRRSRKARTIISDSDRVIERHILLEGYVLAPAVCIINVASPGWPFVFCDVQLDQQAMLEVRTLRTVRIDRSAVPELLQEILKFITADFVITGNSRGIVIAPQSRRGAR